MHKPAFPPEAADWRPGNPQLGESPLPLWARNPKSPFWIPGDARQKLEKRYGYYSVRRAEAMVPQSYGVEGVVAAARKTWQGLQATYGIGAPIAEELPEITGPKPVGRPRLKEAVGGIPEKALASLIKEVVNAYTVSEIWATTTEIIEWAKDIGKIRISPAQAGRVLELAKQVQAQAVP